MNFFFWKKNKQIDIFAILLADEFYSHIQPQVAIDFVKETTRGRKQSGTTNRQNIRINKILEDSARQIIAFKEQHSLGVYGKARLHLIFMQRLNQLGYSEDITKYLNEIILVRSP